MKKRLIIIFLFVIFIILCLSIYVFFIRNSLNKTNEYFYNIPVSNGGYKKTYILLNDLKKDFTIDALRGMKGYPIFIQNYKNISFVRKTNNFYYSVFKTSNNSCFYIFCDKQGVIVSTFLLNKNDNSKIKQIKIGDSFEKVKGYDESAILQDSNATHIASQHVFNDGDQYSFIYEKNAKVYVVKDIIYNEKLCKEYIDEILPYDLPK